MLGEQNALYQDGWLVAVAEDFAEQHVNSIFRIAGDARHAISDSFITRVGRAFYETTLVGANQMTYASKAVVKISV